jgi:hypothetical protein
LSVKSTEKPDKPKDTRKAVAIEAKLPERKIRLAQEIKKIDPAVSAMVRAGDIPADIRFSFSLSVADSLATDEDASR